VRYDEFAPMLLNEMQLERKEMLQKLQALSEKNADQAAEIRDLKQQVSELNDVKKDLRAAIRQLPSKGELFDQVSGIRPTLGAGRIRALVLNCSSR
jgi:Tfp pilus assembly protein PilO